MQNPITRIEAHRKRVDEMNGKLELPPTAMAIDLLRLIYRCGGLPLTTRMRAAMAAVPFETPKLGVTAVVSDSDLASVLDRRLRKLDEMRSGKHIELATTPLVEVKPYRPHIADKRYRRF